MQFGDFRIEIVSDAPFKLDGGAMFGVVPRNLWEKVLPPDEQNRVRLATNCLYIETAGEKILIETGAGEKFGAKQMQIYGIEREKSFAEILFEKTGATAAEISIVVNTHLHFDHCGGNTIFDNQGDIVPQFPNARYFVSENEFRHAENPTRRDSASYLAENWQPLADANRLELKLPVYEVVKGITMTETRGHNNSMQTVKIESGAKVFYSFSDLIPTTPHLSPAWIMSYDLFPLKTLENKMKLTRQAVAENWLCWFYHDADTPLCRLAEIDGKLKTIEI